MTDLHPSCCASGVQGLSCNTGSYILKTLAILNFEQRHGHLSVIIDETCTTVSDCRLAV